VISIKLTCGGRYYLCMTISESANPPARPTNPPKSEYYQHPYMREVWRTAFNALCEAETVSLIGYSLPTADLVMVGMLRSALSGRRVAVDIVNPCPEDLHARLGAFDIAEVTSSESVVEFGAVYRDRAARDFVKSLASLDLENASLTSLLAAKSRTGIGQAGSPIVRIEREGDTIRLVTAAPDRPLHEALASEYDATTGQPLPDVLPRLNRLLAESEGATQLVVRRNGIDETVVGCLGVPWQGGPSSSWMAFESV
jgi:hypothetical protein